MKHLSTFLLALAFLLPTLGFAQATTGADVQVKGQIKDSINNEAISYATVRVVEKIKPSIAVKALATDEAGKFRFALNKHTDYILSINYVGKKALVKNFTIANNNAVDLGVLLMASDANVLKEVVVAAQKPIVKIDLDKITYSMEDDPDSKTNTVLEMLKKVPMVTVDGEDKIELKGSTSFKIYMNGKPSNMISSNPKEILKSMPANTVKDIEVITDPGAKYDAEGLAGIINIITVKNTSMGGYTASANSRVDSRGGGGVGAYVSFKSGKFGFTGNYNISKYKEPKGSSWSYREAKNQTMDKYLDQTGYNKYDGTWQYGSGEFSYEIDTLNLINLGYNGYLGDNDNGSFADVVMKNIDKQDVYSYNRESRSKSDFGGPTINLDYQKTSAKLKDRLLTASYRYSFSPNNSESQSSYKNLVENIPRPDATSLNLIDNKQFTDASMKGHTFQLDYTTPYKKIHTFEAGLKYVLQFNESTSGRQFFKDNAWVSVPDPANDRFKHQTSIPSAYAGYNVKYKNYGFKAGLRFEGTYIDAKFPLAVVNNFKSDYSNLVPSVTFTYQLKPTQTIRLGYNQRIQRPGIWQLNPYVNTTDPTNISYGNTNLNAAKSHNFNLNYSYFKPKFNLNASLSYDYVSNSIERYRILKDDVFENTYGNIGKKNNYNLFAYFSWSPSTKFRLSSNLSGGYVDLKSTDIIERSNHGFTGRGFVNAQLTLPKAYKVGVYGGTGSAPISLQDNGKSYSFHGMSLSKSFLKEKLDLRLSVNNPFKRWETWGTTDDNTSYLSKMGSNYEIRQISFSVSYRFGEMKAQIKKAKRGITGEDSSGGDAQGGSQGGGGGQGGGN